MGLAQSRDDRIRRLTPLIRLAPAELEALLGDATVLDFRAGEIIYSQDEDDDFAHYLLEGVVEALWNGRLVKSVDLDHVAARRSLDPPGPKAYTLRARTDASILRVTRSALERQLRLAELATRPAGSEEAAHVPATASSGSLTRLLRAEPFAHLPAPNVQKIRERMEEIAVGAGDVIARQGEAGNFYYVIDRGQCEVTRRPAGGGGEVHLAELGPGLAFGEEALIADIPLHASVRMLTDGRLLRLDGSSFQQLVRDPLLHEVNSATGQKLVEDGGAWLDIREPEQFAGRAFKDAVNIPLTRLRDQCRRLDREQSHVVCSDDPASSAVGAFLLAQRGFRASFLNQPLSELDIDPTVADEAEAPVDDLTVGLAARVETDDMNEQRRAGPESGAGEEVEFAMSDFAKTEVTKSPRDPHEDTGLLPLDMAREDVVAVSGPALARFEEDGSAGGPETREDGGVASGSSRPEATAWAGAATEVEAKQPVDDPTAGQVAAGEGDDMNEHRRVLPEREVDAENGVEIPGDFDTEDEETGGVGESIARDLLSDTEIGQSLADLIEDMGVQRLDLEGESGVAVSGPELVDFDDEEAAPPSEPREDLDVSRGLPVPDRKDTPEAGQDELSRLMRELERRLRNHVERRVQARREQLEKRLHERVAGVKQAAGQQIRKNAEAVRRAFEQDYAQKRSALRRDYERLIRLASKVTRQKAEIQQARRDLAEKLKIANELHKKVDEIRRVLTQRIGNIEGMESGGERGGHPL